MINFNVNFTGLDDILRRLTGDRVAAAVKAMTTGLARLLLRFSQQAAPVATGNLRRSGFMMVDGDGLHAVVGYGTKYAGVVEGGSTSHVISAINARTLAFVPTSFSTLDAALAASRHPSRRSGNPSKATPKYSIAFPQHVLHPGTTANPFLAQGWEDSKPDAQDFLGQVGARWASGEDQDE